MALERLLQFHRHREWEKGYRTALQVQIDMEAQAKKNVGQDGKEPSRVSA